MGNETNSPSIPVVPRKFMAAFIMLVSCFALWGLLNNMTDNLVPAFKNIFSIPQEKSALVQVAFYGAYAVLAIFASILIEEFSYKKGVLIGLGVYILGALMYIPACIAQSFDIYFVAIFVVAGGCSLLETTCNPYVLSMGPQETAVRRLNFAQAFNPVGSIAGILLAQQLILSNLNPATADERALMPAEQLKEIVHHELFWVCAPYVGLCGIAFLIWLFFLGLKEEKQAVQQNDVGMRILFAVLAGIITSTILASLFPEKSKGVILFCGALCPLGYICLVETAKERAGEKISGGMRVLIAALYSVLPLVTLNLLFPEMNKVAWVLCGTLGPIVYICLVKNYRETLLALLAKPRYWCGVIAQFFYVGVQIAAWTYLNVYCCKELGVTPATAASYYLISLVLFIACRWVATYFMKMFNPAAMMALFAVAAIACCAGVMYLPSTVLFTVGGLDFSANVLCLIAMSGCMSLMFPTIYGIALGGLDEKIVKLGAAGLIMAILGGALITPWMAGVLGDAESMWISLLPGFDNTWDTNLGTSSAAVRASFVVPAICFAVVLAYSLIFRKKKD